MDEKDLNQYVSMLKMKAKELLRASKFG